MKGCNMNDTWFPTPIEKLRKNFVFSDEYSVVSDVCYSIQYLEFLSHELATHNLTMVIRKQIIKNYIIVASGIIEAIFYTVCKNKKIVKKKSIHFDTLIRLVLDNNLLSLSSKECLVIHSLRRLRNKVHIYSNTYYYDTSFNSFNFDDYDRMRDILKIILSNKEIALEYKGNI